MKLAELIADQNMRLHNLRKDIAAIKRPDLQSETNRLLRKILVELEILNGRQRVGGDFRGEPQ